MKRYQRDQTGYRDIYRVQRYTIYIRHQDVRTGGQADTRTSEQTQGKPEISWDTCLTETLRHWEQQRVPTVFHSPIHQYSPALECAVIPETGVTVHSGQKDSVLYSSTDSTLWYNTAIALLPFCQCCNLEAMLAINVLGLTPSSASSRLCQNNRNWTLPEIWGHKKETRNEI